MQQKKATTSLSSSAIRLPKDVMRKMGEHAKRETRSVPGQITVALREWLALKEGSTVQHSPTRIIANVPRNTPGGTSTQGRVKLDNPGIPEDVAQKVMSDEDEGWERTDTKTLGGTKEKK